jgi:poly-gamma-glutamate capsule biosynthesis protein CapA/YwtB (metallophosphatase superfamily)
MRRVLAPTVGTAYMATSVVRPSALAAGGAVVLGAHPHVLQPVERPDRFRLVAWSLGNFVFAANSPGTTSTGILLVHLALDGVRGARLVPVRIEGVRPSLLP